MAGGSKKNGNSKIGSKCVLSNAFSGADDAKKPYDSNQGLLILMPKHVPLPEMPKDSDFIFEVHIFVYSLVSMALQYINLYKTVWWLPHSHTKYALNFYLIDPYLLLFLIIILSRRLVKVIIGQVISVISPPNCKAEILKISVTISRLMVSVVVMLILLWCCYYMATSQSIINLSYLCYPLSVYATLYGPKLTPLFSVVQESTPAKSQELRGMAPHVCNSTPELVREEVDKYRMDFNTRMKSVLFNTLLNSYCAGFIPCCFAPPCLHYDNWWVTQHLLFTWLSSFTMHFLHVYPAGYCDTLHRAALHLGSWKKVEHKSPHAPCATWSDNALWEDGSLTKHSREIFKARGIANAAEPGNFSHWKFHLLFQNPSLLTLFMLSVQFLLVLVQLVVLVSCSEWYQVISLSLLLFCNYYTLFKLLRDYLVLWRVYKAESMLQKKVQSE